MLSTTIQENLSIATGYPNRMVPEPGQVSQLPGSPKTGETRPTTDHSRLKLTRFSWSGLTSQLNPDISGSRYFSGRSERGTVPGDPLVAGTGHATAPTGTPYHPRPSPPPSS